MSRAPRPDRTAVRHSRLAPGPERRRLDPHARRPDRLPAPQRRLSFEAGWYRGSLALGLIGQAIHCGALARMTDEEGMLAPSAIPGFTRNRVTWFISGCMPWIRVPAGPAGPPLTRYWLRQRARPVIIGVSEGLRPAPGVPCHQILRGGDTVKTAILNSVGIILVVAACLILCVALNAVSTG